MLVESMQHSLNLNISTVGANKVDLKEYCRSITPDVEYDGYRLYTLYNAEIYHQEWLDSVNERLRSKLTESSFMFVREPSSESVVHKDFYPPHRSYIYGLNYVVDACDTSRMTWHDHQDGSEQRLKYPFKPTVEIETVQIPYDTLMLIDTTTYHSIHIGNKERWCMSLRTEECTYNPDNPLSWENILEKYQKIVI